MNETFLLKIDMLTKVGFLDTGAPLYLDLIVSFLALLPFIIIFAILSAAKGSLRTHKFIQTLFFFLTLLTLTIFSYFIHYQDGFTLLLQKNIIDSTQVNILLFIHITIAFITLILWMFTLIYALQDRRRRALPGVYSGSHRKSGKRVFLGIFLTSLSSIGIYWMLFMA